jgi:hypothetical protein
VLDSGLDVALPFPFPFVFVGPTAVLELASKIDCDRKALVALLRKGFSNASFIFFTLTCPKPGRVCRRSAELLAISAKLCL